MSKTLSGNNPSPHQRIRLLTYNIHGCVGHGGIEDPQGVLKIIEAAGADFVALQEVQDDDDVDRSFLRGLERLDYAEVIYGETMRKSKGPYGNILLSKHPLHRIQRVNISSGSQEPRGLILAESSVCGAKVRIMATHLGLKRRERSHQIDQILGVREGPTDGSDLDVLMGDMNEWYSNSRNSRRLDRAYTFVSGLRTFPARWPLLPLDRILVRGGVDSVNFSSLNSSEAKIVSDHRPLIADIFLSGGDCIHSRKRQN